MPPKSLMEALAPQCVLHASARKSPARALGNAGRPAPPASRLPAVREGAVRAELRVLPRGRRPPQPAGRAHPSPALGFGHGRRRLLHRYHHPRPQRLADARMGKDPDAHADAQHHPAPAHLGHGRARPRRGSLSGLRAQARRGDLPRTLRGLPRPQRPGGHRQHPQQPLLPVDRLSSILPRHGHQRAQAYRHARLVQPLDRRDRRPRRLSRQLVPPAPQPGGGVWRFCPRPPPRSARRYSRPAAPPATAARARAVSARG